MAAKMEPDGWVPVQLTLRAQPGVRYRVDVQIQDVHGFTVHRTLELAAAGPAGQRAVAATEAPC
jgi:hypothetical protein